MKKHYMVICVGSAVFLCAFFLFVKLPEFSSKGSEIDVYILIRQQTILDAIGFVMVYMVFAALVLGHGIHSALIRKEDDIEQDDGHLSSESALSDEVSS